MGMSPKTVSSPSSLWLFVNNVPSSVGILWYSWNFNLCRRNSCRGCGRCRLPSSLSTAGPPICAYADNRCVIYSGGGGGGFFIACEDIGRMFEHSFPACTFFKFYLKWRSARTLIPLFTPGSVHMAQWAETTVAEYSLTSCVWAHFQIGSLTMPGQLHSQPTLTSLSQECMRV